MPDPRPPLVPGIQQARQVEVPGVGVPAQPVYLLHGGTLTIHVHPNPAHVDNLAAMPVTIPPGLMLMVLPADVSAQIAKALNLGGAVRADQLPSPPRHNGG